jgi:hypothetical protein
MPARDFVRLHAEFMNYVYIHDTKCRDTLYHACTHIIKNTLLNLICYYSHGKV